MSGRMSETQPERRRWPPLIWACVAMPLWAAGSMLPVALYVKLSGAPPGTFPFGALLTGMCACTAILLAVDARIGPPGRAPWTPPAAWLLGTALLAGCGATILVSELHNVLMAMTDAAIDTRPKPDGAPAIIALLSVAQPLCLVIVLQGVVQRALHSALPMYWAVAGAMIIGGVFGGGAFLRVAPVFLLPAWLFARTGSLSPSMAALLPAGLFTGLEALGLGLGVPGFDVQGVDAQWQPIWFNVLGGVLLAAGMAPLLRTLGPADTDP